MVYLELFYIPFFPLLVDVLTTNFLLVTDYTHGKVFQISIENETIVQLPFNIKKVIGLAFSQLTKTLYYSENSTKTITSTTLQGENATLLFASGKLYHDKEN